ncbi:hypothetical protein EXIGLDRAFT_835125 [Exidia glandulosa HHB12029]|uniref:F-box domain-containing protein n=1 Tax=Exidia glandulosa HHB12029 TaxID=1314781 RepID=A0A165J2X1_EXIGL|nr:hypothetical protein EXIGLDRAFT_835125 [Exidia glandulosa HHB12029]
MSTLSALPVELVLIVVEHAAWSVITADKHWVGSLRLVSRRFDRTIKTIYFHTLILRYQNRGSIEKLAQLPDTPLSLTRHFVDTGNYDDIIISEESFYALSANVRDFTGSLTHYQHLTRRNSALNLDSVFITTPMDAPRMHWLISIPRVHVTYDTWREDLFSLAGSDSNSLGDAQIRWLIVDAFSADAIQTAVDVIPQFLSSLSGLLKIPSLKRLLLRPRIIDEESHDFFCDAATRWALVTRDERIWLDGTGAPGEWTIPNVRAWDVDDALAGHGLWLTGAQLYTRPFD